MTFWPVDAGLPRTFTPRLLVVLFLGLPLQSNANHEGQEATAVPVDIIFVVDTSGSMDYEKNLVQQGMNAFATQLFLADLDFRIVMIAEESPDGPCINVPLGSGSCPDDSNPPGYLHLFETVGSSNALQKVLDTAAQWGGQMRANAFKHVVAVTDDDSALSAEDFNGQFMALDASHLAYVFHAFVASVAPDPLECVLDSFCCEDLIPLAAARGQEYIDLIQLTDGIFGDLCGQDMTSFFNELAAAIIQGYDPSLVVNKSGTGAGSVTSSPPGIDCGLNCQERFPSGSLVTLTATPDGGSDFSGWSSPCSDGDCNVLLNASTAVNAYFCGPSLALGCDSQASSSMLGQSADLQGYSCPTLGQPGPDLMYSLRPAESGKLTLDLTGLTGDLDLMLLDHCDPGACLASSENAGTTPEQIEYSVRAGHTYFVVVEDWTASGSDFTLSAACDSCVGPDVDLVGRTIGQGETLQCDVGNILVQDLWLEGTLVINMTGTAQFESPIEVRDRGHLQVHNVPEP